MRSRPTPIREPQRRPSLLGRGAVIALALALPLAPALPTAHAQMLPIDAPVAEPSPVSTEALAQQVTLLQREAGDLQRQVQHANEPLARLAAAASAQLRLQAAAFLQAGLNDSTPEAAVHVRTGLTLLAGRASLDQAMVDLLGKAQAAREQPANTPALAARALELERARRAVEQAVAQPVTPVATDGAGDAFIETWRRLNWLLPMIEAVAGPVGRAWPADKSASDAEAARVLAPPTPVMVEQAVAQVHAAAEKLGAAVSLEQMVDPMKAAVVLPTYRPRVARTLDDLAVAVQIASLLAQADWLDAGLRDRLIADWAAAVNDHARSNRHAAARERLSQLREVLPMLARINALADADDAVDVAPLIRLLELTLAGTSEARASLLMPWLARVTQVMLDRRTLPAPTTLGDLRLTYVTLQRQAAEAEAGLLKLADDLAQRPDQVTLPAFQLPLKALEQRLVDLQHLALLRDRIAAINTLRPDPIYGVTQRLKNTARALDGPRSDTASRTLTAFVDQVDRFMTLPLETRLRPTPGQPESAAPLPIVGQRANAMAQRIDTLRNQWANAWANGATAASAGEVLARAEQTFNAIAAAERLNQLTEDLDALNAWAGLQIEPAVVEGVQRRLLRAAEGAVDVLLGDEPARVLQLPLGESATDQALAQLLVDLHAQLRTDPPLPIGPAGVLAQTLMPAHPKAAMVEADRPLAWLTQLLNEQAHGEAVDTDRLNKAIEATNAALGP